LARPDDSRLRVVYRLGCAERGDAVRTAREIALEQTVELPEGTFGEEIEREVVGVVEEVSPCGDSAHRAVVSFDPRIVGDEIPQLLTLLYGNLSLKTSIRIDDIDWPGDLLTRFAGPSHGIDGLRTLCGVERRPLLCSALKPMGLSPRELARRCHDLVLGGIDLVKDDHGLADQDGAPFAERVWRCQEAVALAHRQTNGRGLYFPNVTGRSCQLEQRVQLAAEAGCKGVLISPLVQGVDSVRWIAERFGLAVLAHPALSGAYFGPDHGIKAEILLGELFRIAGSDGVIYPNFGGRFPLSEETCLAINDRLRRPLGALRPSFPVPAGGIDVVQVPHWVRRYGPDTVFLIGGSLYARGDLARASAELLDAVNQATVD
jgi:ribulose-bisphosphate carboxylase large chain